MLIRGQFAHLEHAKAAQSLNGKLDIAGRTIKVKKNKNCVGQFVSHFAFIFCL